ncbi:MAG: hypothetical protein QXM75_00670 [Candidatus Diapherotrites archaeon]
MDFIEEDSSPTLKERYIAFCERRGIPKALPIVLILLIILAFFAYWLFFSQEPTKPPKRYTFTVYFKDEKGAPISGIDVNFVIGNEPKIRRTDDKGKISFSVDENAVVRIVVKHPLYLDEEWNFTIKEDTDKTLTLKLREKPLEKRILRFETSKGSTRGKFVTVWLSCSNKSINPWKEVDIDKDGYIEVTLPLDCKELKVENAELENHEFERAIQKGTEILVIFKEIEIPKGALRVKIVDEKKELILKKNIVVNIEKDGTKQVAHTQGYGLVDFDGLLPGLYNVFATDPEQTYSGNCITAVVRAKETTEVYVELSKKISAVLLVRTIEMETQSAVENVEVKVLFDKKAIASDITKEGGVVRFSFFDFGKYTVVAKKEGYFPKTLDINISSSMESLTVELERITEANSGRTIVKVLDEDGAPVKDAKVMFKYKATDSIVELPSSQNYKLTDSNGIAEFVLGWLSEEVYPFVIKYPASGGSAAQAKKIIPDENNYFEVTITIGKSILKVSAFDSRGIKIPESYFEVFSSIDRNSLTKGKIVMVDGEKEYEVKAAQSIYVVVSKDGFLNYESETIQLWPNETYEIKAVLLKEGELPKPKIEFLGIFDQNGGASASIKAGKEYVAKFMLFYPPGASKVGFHFRIGEKSDVNLEPAFIKGVDIKGTMVRIGKTYNPPKSEALEEIVGSDGKWVSIEWLSPKASVYTVPIKIKIKDSTRPKTPITFHYRSYAVINTAYVREPYDEELGDLERTSTKDALYAKTHEIRFYEGSEGVCKELFCVTGVWMYDAQEDIFLKEPYSTVLFGDYNLILDLLNNSQKEYGSLEIRIKNKTQGKSDSALVFEKMLITADIEQKEYMPQDNEFKENLVGFDYGKTLNTNIRFKTNDETTTNIAIDIIADKFVVFSKVVPIKVYSVGKLDVNIEPEKLAPFTEYELKVNIRDGEKKKVKDVLVTMHRTHDDGTNEVVQQLTDANGLAVFKLVESLPNTRVEITAEKMGYSPFKKVITIDSNVARVVPESVSVSLNTSSKTEEKIVLSLENKSGSELLLKSVRFVGNFYDILDEKTMNANATTVVGQKVKPKDQLDFALKVLLSPNAESLLQSNTQISGSIEIIVLVQKHSLTYTFVVPFTANVSLGGLPENAPCISLSGPNVPEWNIATVDNLAKTEVKLSNLCVSNGKPVDLENLQAKLTWASNSKKAGAVEITINSPGGATVTKILRSGVWTKLFDKFENELRSGTYSTIITFKPGEEYKGETAIFTIEFDGQIKTDKGLVFVGADSKINANILIVNLKDCIRYPKKIVLKPEQNETTMTIDANSCNINISVWLCKDDPRCRGGTKEGGITLVPYEELKFTKNETSKTITIHREQIPGIYGITLYAKAPETEYQYIDTIDTIIEPGKGQYFSMNRYEFILTAQTNWKDSANLINKMWVEDVNITAKLCTACREGEELPEYCVMNKALQRATLDKPGFWVNVAVAAGAGLLAGVTCATQGGFWAGVLCFVGAAITTFFTISGAQCDVQMATYAFMDYVINLPSDIKRLEVLELPYDVALSKEEGESNYSKKEQIVTINFENNTNRAAEKGEYGILEIVVNEHIHGDPTHLNPKMERDKADFGVFNVPDTETREYSQKVHLRFVTNSNIGDKLKSISGLKGCSLGTKTGYLAEDVSPKVKLDWRWDSIDWNSCDAENESAIYCDAVQNSIALTKRLYMLEEFFKANDYYFACPKHPRSVLSEGISKSTTDGKSTAIIRSNEVGISNLDYKLNASRTAVTLSATIENKTSEDQKLRVKFLLKSSDYAKECEKEINVVKNTVTTVECLFDNLDKGKNDVYFGLAYITQCSRGCNTSKEVTVAFTISADNGECWIPYSTKKIEGVPALFYFIDRNLSNWNEYVNVKEIKWPSGWPGSTVQEKIQFLKKLLEFDALLIMDGYTEDFKSDFAEYYTTQTFFEVPFWFKNSGGFKEYFISQNALAFETGNPERKLLGPGRYHVFLEIDFNNSFSFFRNNKPNALVKVKYSKISPPEPESLFYYWPIDGEVGLKSSNGRIGYGSGYENTSKPITISNYGGIELRTEGSKGAPLVKVRTEIIDDIKYTNVDPKTRGNILSGTIKENELLLRFSPNTASIAIMKVSDQTSKKLDEKLTASYKLLENGKTTDVGDNLAYWNWIESCKSSENESLSEILNYPDKKLEPETYGLEFDRGMEIRNDFFSSVFFSPQGKNYVLTSASPNVKFLDQQLSEHIAHNLKGAENPEVGSIKELIEKAKEGLLCVDANDNSMSLWWNPKALKENSVINVLTRRSCN